MEEVGIHLEGTPFDFLRANKLSKLSLTLYRRFRNFTTCMDLFENSVKTEILLYMPVISLVSLLSSASGLEAFPCHAVTTCNAT